MADPTSFGVTSFIEFCYKIMASELGVISATSKQNYYEGYVSFTEEVKEHIKSLKESGKVSSLDSELSLWIYANGEEKEIKYNGKEDLVDSLELQKRINLLQKMCGCTNSIDDASLDVSIEAIYDTVSRKINGCDNCFSIMEFIFETEDKNKECYENIVRNRINHAKQFFDLSEERVSELLKITGISLMK